MSGDDYCMKKRISIIFTAIAVIILGGFTYYGSLTETNQETDSIVTDKDGEIVEPLSGNKDSIGH